MRQRRRAIIRICLSALLFVPLFTALFAGLTPWRMNDTILSAEYYAVPLAESGFYEFLITEAVLSALNEARIEEDLAGDSVHLSNERLAVLAYSLHPPDLLRDKVEYVLSEMGRYATGETDSFSMTVLPGLREDAGHSAVKCPILLSLLSINVTAKSSARMSHHGECDIEPARTDKTTDP